MDLDNIGIAITRACNARCAMCCSGAISPENASSRMAQDDLRNILRELRDIETIKGLGITGGEPMTVPEYVDEILQYDFGRPLHISLKTNGFWGADYDYAQSFLKKHSDTINNLSLSYDSFHGEYIDVTAIQNLINICWELGIPCEVVGCFTKYTASPGEILDSLGEAAYKTRYKYQPTFRTGLAKDIPDADFIKLYKAEDSVLPCVGAYLPSLLIDADLNVFPCCAQPVQNTVLKIGNMKEKSLVEILDMVKGNKLLVHIFTEGLSSLAKLLDVEDIDPQGYSAPCEVCEALFATDKYLPIIYEKMQKQEL